MSLRCSAFTSLLVIGFLTGPSTPTALAQGSREVESVVEEFSASDTEGFRVVTTRDERESGAFERSVLESPSINGGSMVLSEVEDQELRIGAETTRRTRREFVTDPNMSPLRRLASNVKDAAAYFGFKAVFLEAGRK